jgi:hypothetical protein
MDKETLKKRLMKEWTCLVLSVTGAMLVFTFILPRVISDDSYCTFYTRTGWNLGDFVFVSLIILVYLVRVIAWSMQRALKK